MSKRKIIIILISVVILLILVVGGTVLFMKLKSGKQFPSQVLKKEKTAEEILNSLTAPPSGEKTKVAEKTLKSLSAPGGEAKFRKISLKNLTAPK